jgi:PAS domain S-box-containing protein
VLTLFNQVADAGHRFAQCLRATYVNLALRRGRNAELALEVSERTRVAEALARSEERLRLAMEATAFGTFEWDTSTNRVRCSPNVKQQLALFSEGELTLEDMLGRVHPDDREPLRGTMRDALNPTGPRTYAREFRTLLPDGHLAWIEGHGAVMFSPGGQPQCMVGIVVDITERRERETQLRQTAAELGASNRMKDEFVATLAHELRNPLVPIRNGLEILTLQGGANPTQRRVCAVMGRQVNHIVHLVDDLLDVSRINQRKLRLKKERVGLRQMVEAAVEVMQPQIDAAGHALKVDIPNESVWLAADPVRIVQAIGNLLANSIRYTPAGGRIAVSAQLGRGGVELCVMDNGIGITQDMLPHVFDMFTQDTERHSEAGLGIGLALTRALVEMHGGSIQAQSDGAGAGSVFSVWLPVLDVGEADSPETEVVDVSGSPRRRVLIVDDNADAADSTADLLQLMGHEVREARDGLQAVAVAEAFTPDVILMDIGMPGVDGREAARRIRRLPVDPSPVIVALTGWDPARERSAEIQSVFDMHLVKPVDAKSLAEVLRELTSAGDRS